MFAIVAACVDLNRADVEEAVLDGNQVRRRGLSLTRSEGTRGSAGAVLGPGPCSASVQVEAE